jgi:hypothetical protein
MTIDLLTDGEGFKDVELIRVSPGTSALSVVHDIALKSGFGADEVYLFVEDEDLPIEIKGLLVDESFRGRLHHIHRALHVEALIFYKERHVKRRFSPATRLQRILDWAVSPSELNIDPLIAPEMELAIPGIETPLPKTSHLGRYVHHPCGEVKFDLIRGIIPNGASR